MAATDEGVTIQERLESYLANEEEPIQTEEVQESVDDIEAKAEPETEALEETAGAENEGESLGLEDLATYLGLDVDKLDLSDDGVYVKTKIDGVEGRAKFSDLVKSYQLEGHLNKQSTAVAEKQKQLERQIAEVEQAAQAKLNQLEDVTRLAHNKLLSDFNKVNWKELREDDPAEFAAKQSDFQRANQEIQKAFQHLQYERQQQHVKYQEQYQQFLSDQSRKLLDSIPEWNDSAIASKEKSELSKYAANLGFTPEEVGSISDHRVVNMLRKAMLYDNLQSTKPAIEKKVRKAPKLVKPGHATTQQSRDEKSLANLRKQVKQSGGKLGVTELLMAKGIV